MLSDQIWQVVNVIFLPMTIHGTKLKVQLYVCCILSLLTLFSLTAEHRTDSHQPTGWHHGVLCDWQDTHSRQQIRDYDFHSKQHAAIYSRTERKTHPPSPTQFHTVAEETVHTLVA